MKLALLVFAVFLSLTVQISPDNAVRSRDDLLFDEQNHLKFSYILYSGTPICSSIFQEVWASNSNYRSDYVLPFDPYTEYAQDLIEHEDAILKNVRSGLACWIHAVTKGTPYHMAQHSLPGKKFYLPLPPVSGGITNDFVRQKLELSRILNKLTTIEVALVNHHFGKPCMIEFVSALDDDNVKSATVTLQTGYSLCLLTKVGFPIRVMSDYRYFSPDVELLTANMSNSENRAFIEGGELDESILNIDYDRSPYKGILILDEAFDHTVTRYLGYFDYGPNGDAIPSSFHPALDVTFGLNKKTIQGNYERLTALKREALPEEAREDLLFAVLKEPLIQSEKVTRTFSKLGFGVGHLTPTLHMLVYTFWYNNKHLPQLEPWEPNNVITNSHDVVSHMHYMPCRLKAEVSSLFQEMVSKWVNSHIHPGNINTDELGGRAIPERHELETLVLETTSLYGIRVYHHGARLLAHVDRILTHACSIIVQIGQDDIEEVWPLQVYDHAGRLHEVTMTQGDIVYYESAKNIHARVTVLHGKNFANIFAHYRPFVRDPNTNMMKDKDSDWYTRPNPLGTAKPLSKHDEEFKNDIQQSSHNSSSSKGKLSVGGGKEDYATAFLSAEKTELLVNHEQLYDAWSEWNCPGPCSEYRPPKLWL